MAEYKIDKDGNLTTIWDEAEGIGLQFAEGDTLQEYNRGLVIKDSHLPSTEEGVRHIIDVQAELTAYARKHYPKEFEPLKD